MSLSLDSLRNFLVLEFIEQLHQEERKLQFVCNYIVQVFNLGVLYTNLNEVLSGDFWSIVKHLSIIFILCRNRKHVLKVHLRNFEAYLITDLDRTHVLV